MFLNVTVTKLYVRLTCHTVSTHCSLNIHSQCMQDSTQSEHLITNNGSTERNNFANFRQYIFVIKSCKLLYCEYRECMDYCVPPSAEGLAI